MRIACLGGGPAGLYFAVCMKLRNHVNSILMAGCADLVCIARPQLANPYWTLHAAAVLGDEQEPWPAPYRTGGEQLNRLTARAEGLLAGERG